MPFFMIGQSFVKSIGVFPGHRGTGTSSTSGRERVKRDLFIYGTLEFCIETFTPAMLCRLAHGGRRGMSEDNGNLNFLPQFIEIINKKSFQHLAPY